MSQMREFNFQKTYEEFKIGGKVYKMEFNDDAIKRYQAAMMKYMEEGEKLQAKANNMEELKKLTPIEHEKLFQEALDMAEEILDTILGKGAFEELYEASGRSSEQMKLLVEWLGEFVAEKTQAYKLKKKKKYVK